MRPRDPMPHVRAPIVAALVAVMLFGGACSGTKAPTAPPRPPCPLGSWAITGDAIRTLLGSGIGGTPESTTVSGRIRRNMRESGETVFEFSDVVLSGAPAGRPQQLRLQGLLSATTTYTADRLDATLTGNTVAVNLNDGSGDTRLTIAVTTFLEKVLTGAATYTCGRSTLTTTDLDSKTVTVWFATPEETAKTTG